MIKKIKRGIGLVLIALGLFIIFIQPLSMTGAVIDISTFMARIWFFVGIITIITGVLLISQKLEERAESSASYQRLKDKLKFMQSHWGYSPESKEAWVTMYHGYPKGAERNFSQLNYKKAKDGFYFAPRMSDVVEFFEGNGIEREDIDIVPVKFSKRVFDPKDKTGIVKEAPAYAADYYKIPTTRYKQANKLIQKGLIKIGNQ